MRRHVLQRWSIILLLIGRLVLGEFVHAAPQVHEGATPASQSQQACPDHAGGPSPDLAEESHHGTPVDAAPNDAEDCCDTGSCECPCVHVSAMAAPSVAVNLVSPPQTRTAIFADGLLQHRLFAPFRPPA
ncbi:MAG: CopL family metal-binding regulatory protein [Steroidobacter sp.]